MLKIRLQRIGRRNQPYYRVVVTDSKFGPKSGRFIEVLGSYDPKAGKIEIKKDRAEHWIAQGAQTSGTVHNFLVDKKVVKGKKINVLPQKTPVKKEVEEGAEATAPAAAPVEEAPVEEKAEETPKEDVKEPEAPVEDKKEDVSSEAAGEVGSSEEKEAPKESTEDKKEESKEEKKSE